MNSSWCNPIVTLPIGKRFQHTGTICSTVFYHQRFLMGKRNKQCMLQIKHIQNHYDKRSHSTILAVHNMHTEGCLLFNKVGPTYQYTIKHLYFPKHINHYIREAAYLGPNPLGRATI